ncbi:Arm DNA-binding domain-containing protein [Bacillus songklensis]|uniref:Arm DNA-binding domain-containing protein n=1 Tax=Bacillus songklensis TaxID=1069116 RepID=A0ABV8B7R0_9BACI
MKTTERYLHIFGNELTRFHVTDPETGKRKEISKGGFKTKKEVSTALTQALAEVETGGCIKPTTLTLIDFYKEYVSTRVEGNLRPNTIKSYRDAQKHVERIIGHAILDKLTALHLNQFIKKLKDEGYQTHTKHMVNVQMENSFLPPPAINNLSIWLVSGIEATHMLKKRQETCSCLWCILINHENSCRLSLL